MNKQQRIALDRRELKSMGFKKIRFLALYDYYNDIQKAVTKFTCKDKVSSMTQYIFPKEINPKEIWEEVKNQLEYEVLSIHDDFVADGIIYNVLVQKDDIKSILLIKYIPTTKEIIMKEAKFDAD